MAGATIAWSSIFIELSHVSGSTAAFFRCLYAVPPLLALAWWEDRRFGSRSWKERMPALIGGVFFGVDLVFWGQAIGDVGAGLATVIANIQVVVLPLMAWLLFSERPSAKNLYAIPVAVAGVVLISGVFESGAYGKNPTTGALFGVAGGLAYVGALMYIRHGGSDLRRPAGPLLDLTLTGLVTSAVMGAIWGNINFVPVFPGAWWLIMLALTSQVAGWLMVTMSLPRLPAALGSLLLMIQPVGSMILGAIIFGAVPSVLQIGGVVLLLGAVVYATRPEKAEALV
jgi:drug/metabolite transporter (DMT)-like permease